MARTQAPCGSWASPLTAASLTQKSMRLSGALATPDGSLFWVEGRPEERGRSVLMRRNRSGERIELTPPPFNVRTTVHEYGGGAFAVAGATVWFVDHGSGQIFETDTRGHRKPMPITPEASPWRFADLQADTRRGRLICVGERHDKHTRGNQEPENALLAIGLDDGEPQRIVHGADFYSSPRLSPDSRQMAWLQWNHPNMPWDSAGLFVADLSDAGATGAHKHIAGDEKASVFGPGYAANGDLIFCFEPQGSWNLHRLPRGETKPLCILEERAECGLPLWQFGMSTWGFVAPRRVALATLDQGAWSLKTVDIDSGATNPVPSDITAVAHLTAGPGRIVVTGSGATSPNAIVSIDEVSQEARTEQASAQVDDDLLAYLSQPQPVAFPTSAGDTAHGYLYAAFNPDFEPRATEQPPLIVMAHGGPTACTSPGLNLGIQYWTTRGFSVFEVNYRGSTGFGRCYRDRLRGQWGRFDVDDCEAAATYLVQKGLVDGERLAIRGSSAGGFTVLAALAFKDTFRAGASLYGIGDLEALSQDTHKFEARYVDRLVAPYPEQAAEYRARSPLHAADQIACPVIFFQGLQDKVVPPAQAESMVAALQARDIPVAYLSFEDEPHGFRQSKTIRRVLEAELSFYGQVFGFKPHDNLEPVTIQGL